MCNRFTASWIAIILAHFTVKFVKNAFQQFFPYTAFCPFFSIIQLRDSNDFFRTAISYVYFAAQTQPRAGDVCPIFLVHIATQHSVGLTRRHEKPVCENS